MKEVRGKLVLITGAAMGMGKLTAEKFAGAGAKLVLLDMNEEELDKTAREIGLRGTNVWKFVQDVTDREGIYALADRIQDEIGTVDILINNAGIVQGGALLETDDALLIKHYEVNVFGCMWFMKAFLPGMIRKGEGHVVNMASASGLIGVPMLSAYASSKWALIGLSESMRLEMETLGHEGIKFSTICPSYVDTGMFKGVKPPLLTTFLKPNTMANKIFEAVVEEKTLVIEPFMVKLTPALKALLPGHVFDAISGLLGATTSARTWRGHGH